MPRIFDSKLLARKVLSSDNAASQILLNACVGAGELFSLCRGGPSNGAL
jgi:hypothetical protein